MVRTKRKGRKIGRGLLNSIINKIPVEMHIPGYQYCGPGTNLKKRLARGDPGINPLDAACKQHDIMYDKYNSGKERYEADKMLASKAWERVKARNASLSERSAALSVAAAMKAKMGLSKLGGGISKLALNHRCIKNRKVKKLKKTKCKKCTFKDLVKTAKGALKKNRPRNIDDAIEIAIKAARNKRKGRTRITVPRIIPLPKVGGALPLIPIFAGLSAIGSLIGSTTGVIKSINAVKEAQKQLEESKRHNRTMEAIAVGKYDTKTGHGLYMKPYKKGLGLYVRPSPSKNH